MRISKKRQFIYLWITVLMLLPSTAMAYVPDDPDFSKQWYLNQIKMPEAWDILMPKYNDLNEVIVAVLDTGVDIDHPDLKLNIWTNWNEIPGNGIDDDNNGYVDDFHGWDFLENTSDPTPKIGDDFSELAVIHGTLVSGIIAAKSNNGKGIAGIGDHKIKIMPLRVLDSYGSGDSNAVARAIDYAIDNGAQVINLSFVGSSLMPQLFNAVKRAYEHGLVVVAAGGNEAAGYEVNLNEREAFPVCFSTAYDDLVIGVGGTDPLDQKAYFSNYGKRCIDVSAPAVQIWGTVFFDEALKLFRDPYDGFYEGTSAATPIVSALAAMARAVAPGISNKDIMKKIEESADNIDDINPKYRGQLGGRLNAEAFIRSVIDSGSVSSAFKPSPEKVYIFAPIENEVPEIKIFGPDLSFKTSFMAFSDNFRGGVNMALGDFDGNGVEEIAVAPKSKGGPQIRIFSRAGKLLGQFFAFDKDLRGTLNISAGDIDGNGRDEIIATFEGGDSSMVRIFKPTGELVSEISPFGDNFKGAVNVSTGDFDGNGVKELVVAPAFGGGPQIRVFNAQGRLLGQFFAFDKNMRYGITPVCGDFDGNGIDEIIVTSGRKGDSTVKMFDSHGHFSGDFMAFGDDFKGTIYISVDDIDGNGQDELIATSADEEQLYRVFSGQGEILDEIRAE